jgi:uncharacterized protein
MERSEVLDRREEGGTVTKPFRVLCLDGGGMRGVYTAAYLLGLSGAFAIKRSLGPLDVGAAFNLIAGTSTGAIIACALAAGLALEEVVELYRKHGRAIFPRKLPSSFSPYLMLDFLLRRKALRAGEAALRRALDDCFGDVTIGSVYATRKIALAIPAVDMSTHKGWVFKTPHFANSSHRDDNYTLTEVCLATTAAPLFRSLAEIGLPGGSGARSMFADGGLWANNPVLVGLIEALQMSAPGQPIHIFCLGTCSPPAGDDVARVRPDRGLLDWKFGGEAAKLAVDAQEYAYDQMARMLSRHLDRPCEIVRFPREHIPAALMKYLDLDDASREAADALINRALSDAQMTNGRCGDPRDREGQIVCQLFNDMTTRI